MADPRTVRLTTRTRSANGTRGEAGLLVAAIALFATTNTVLINLISTSRLVYGVSKEEHGMFPQQFSRIHAGRRTPYLAVGLVGAMACVFALIGDIGTVAALANLAMLTLFLLVNASLIRLRYVADRDEPEFKVPINIGRLPLTAVAGFISALALIVFYIGETV